MLLKHKNLLRKNDTQHKEGGEEMLPHFPPKPHLKETRIQKNLHHVQI